MNRTWSLVFASVVVLLALVPSSATKRNLTEYAINGPYQLAFDFKNNLYVAEHYGHRILKVDLSNSSVAVVAGNGKECCFKEGAAARSVSVYDIESMLADGRGDIYFGGINAKDGAFIREADSATGTVRTIAGGATARSQITANGVLPLEANVRDPKGMVFAKSGSLIFSVDGSYLLAELTDGKAVRVAGRAEKGFSGDGGPATNAKFDLPGFLTGDAEGDIFIADYFNHRIRRIDAQTGIVTTVAGNGAAQSSGDGGPAVEAGVEYPFGIALDSQENLYLIENGAGTIRRVDNKSGLITTIAGTGHPGFTGDGGPATKAEIDPAAIAIDSLENLYFSDIGNNRIREIDLHTGFISTVVGNGLPKRKVIIE
jgi:trimeric autotransporter adhesin